MYPVNYLATHISLPDQRTVVTGINAAFCPLTVPSYQYAKAYGVTAVVACKHPVATAGKAVMQTGCCLAIRAEMTSSQRQTVRDYVGKSFSGMLFHIVSHNGPYFAS